MEKEIMEPRLAQLLAEVVSSAAGSGLTLDQVIAGFGLASKILMEHVDTGAAPLIDPHVAFAKGLAQLADKKSAAYH